VDVLLKILHRDPSCARHTVSDSAGNGNTLNRHTQGEFDREQRVVFRSVESQVDVSLGNSHMNPFEKLLKRARSPVERVCHNLKFKWAQQDRNELATFTLSRSHMHLRAIALDDSFVQSHPPIESAPPSLVLPSMSTITSKA